VLESGTHTRVRSPVILLHGASATVVIGVIRFNDARAVAPTRLLSSAMLHGLTRRINSYKAANRAYAPWPAIKKHGGRGS